jgi:hypothetical protein
MSFRKEGIFTRRRRFEDEGGHVTRLDRVSPNQGIVFDTCSAFSMVDCSSGVKIGGSGRAAVFIGTMI